MKATDVFTPGGFPHKTFVDDHLKDKANILRDALEGGSQIISISGPSKSGKTVFVENVVGKDNLIHVTGAGISSPDSLWGRVFTITGTSLPSGSTSSTALSGSIGGKAGVSAGIIVKGNGELSASAQYSSTTTENENKSSDLLQILIDDLGGTDFVLFIDDFHYIRKDIQEELARQIKEAIRNNVKIVCASVPYHADDVIRANADLRGRTVSLDFDYWTPNVLCKIAEKGFPELNIDYNGQFASSIASESSGSPQLMQTLCLNSCFELGVRNSDDRTGQALEKIGLVNSVCRRTVMSTDYSFALRRMLEGPKTRGSERNKYSMKNKPDGDVYSIVLMALALDPPRLTTRYNDLLSRIDRVCAGQVPSGSSITSACGHIANIANESSNQIIVEWDVQNDVFDIRDPYLLFFMRWSETLSSIV